MVKKSTTYFFTSKWYTLVSYFKMKANIFNKFLASQCVPLNKDCKILYCQRFMTNAIISSVKFEHKDIINACEQMYMMIYL